MPKVPDTNRVHRDARTRWVPIAQMRVNPLAQREVNQARVDYLAANFDPEEIGTPELNWRDGWFWIIDGQHRIEALKQIGWGDQSVECKVYEGLTEQQEAEKFLNRNNQLAVTAIAKFRIAVQAGREVECDIDRIVRSHGLVVSTDGIPGAIGAVGTLHRVYSRAGAAVLSRTLTIVSKAYGDAGLQAAVIDGIALLCQRYGNDLDDGKAIERLAKVTGSVNGLIGKAEALRRATGNQKGHCVAAAAVEIINAGRGGTKLASWWKAAA